jgi:hypothetical protein
MNRKPMNYSFTYIHDYERETITLEMKYEVTIDVTQFNEILDRLDFSPDQTIILIENRDGENYLILRHPAS